ncbi:hypothetical protein ACFOZY_00440 [Chungangia koreensis]|uniref:Cardiolipin synthase N-terminal domain-containing protein n=1 Tax=Chungangia koreensis TaxID=752657 RepID=A0ABV8X3S2_9LACT
MGWSLASQIDFSGYQMEIALFYTIALVMAVWVFYDSDRHFYSFFRHLFWILTLLSGPLGLLVYHIFRRWDVRRNE